MIYLGPVLQKKLLPIFHYALKTDGILMLGSSETIGGFSDLFALADKKEKIYAKKPGYSPSLFAPALAGRTDKQYVKIYPTAPGREELPSLPSLYQKADGLMLSQYSPPSVLINDDQRIVQFRGITSPFLAPSPGEASLDLLQMVREGLRLELRSAIQKARKTNERVRKEGLPLEPGHRSRRVTLDVIPFKATLSQERFFLVVFSEAATGTGVAPVKRTGSNKNLRIVPSPGAQ
jgi:two-component system CheB/CheR fusion protein